MHASTVQIVEDGSGGGRFEDAVSSVRLAPSPVLADPGNVVSDVSLCRDHSGDSASLAECSGRGVGPHNLATVVAPTGEHLVRNSRLAEREHLPNRRRKPAFVNHLGDSHQTF
jgi:hypothetical protein